VVDFLRRNANWIALALVLSLGANLFAGGWIAGRLMHGGHHRMENVSSSDQVNWIVKRIAEDLPEAQRQAFRDAMDSRKDQLIDLGKQMREAREAVKETIKNRPFDRAAFNSATVAFAASQQAFGKEFSSAIGDAIELATGKPASN
jgi:Spy/CpxP family protein refolding chaperone